jgi:hypothetical protein
MGNGPVIDTEGMEADAQYRVDNGIPVIRRFPCWVDQAMIDEETALIDKYSNVDMRLYQDYFDILQKDGNLRKDEGTGMMYLELAEVLQTVVKDENSDVAALLKQAEINFQQYHD